MRDHICDQIRKQSQDQPTKPTKFKGIESGRIEEHQNIMDQVSTSVRIYQGTVFSKPERPQSHTSYLSNTIWTLPKQSPHNQIQGSNQQCFTAPIYKISASPTSQAHLRKPSG